MPSLISICAVIPSSLVLAERADGKIYTGRRNIGVRTAPHAKRCARCEAGGGCSYIFNVFCAQPRVEIFHGKSSAMQHRHPLTPPTHLPHRP